MLKWAIKNKQDKEANQQNGVKRKQNDVNNHEAPPTPFRDLSNIAYSPQQPKRKKRCRSQPSRDLKRTTAAAAAVAAAAVVTQNQNRKRCHSPDLNRTCDDFDNLLEFKKIKVDRLCCFDQKSSITLPNCNAQVCTSSLPINFPFKKDFDKKMKIEHVHDFLRQISHYTQNEDDDQPPQKDYENKKPTKYNIKLSPLTEKLTDLKFTTINDDEKENISESLDDLSLDKIVDVLLETTQKRNFGSQNVSKKQDQLITETNYLHNCQQINPKIGLIQANHLSMAQSTNSLERVQPPPPPSSSNSCFTVENMQEDVNAVDDGPRELSDIFRLTRQKCIKRRKNSSQISLAVNEKATQTSLLSNNTTTNTTKSVNLSESLLFSNQTNKPRTRRCLTFLSPIHDSDNKFRSSAGTLDLNLKVDDGYLIVHVFRCKDLCRQGLLQGHGSAMINAYVKVSLSSESNDDWVKDKAPSYRTDVQKNSSRPYFDEKFRFQVNNDIYHKRLQLEVWHRDRECRRSELLGCMSFPIKNIDKQAISGTFKLLPQSIGKFQYSLSNNTLSHSTPRKLQMSRCDSNNRVEPNLSSANMTTTMESNSDQSDTKWILEQKQKEADQNLFLRYLEVDPIEGPEAIPAALQRKASGNKEGRTPFTATKKLKKCPTAGFGFTVVWTHPPHVEKIEPGLPADKAGIRPGDYIIFIDSHNVVTMPEKQILNLIKSYGDQLVLEIYRRNTVNCANNNGMGNLKKIQRDSIIQCKNLRKEPSTSSILKRNIHVPQVSFPPEIDSSKNDPNDVINQCVHKLLFREEKFLADIQFGVNRYVLPLSKRKDLISPNEHLILFQNFDDISKSAEEMMETIYSDSNMSQLDSILDIYLNNLSNIVQLIKKNVSGLRRANYILATKLKNAHSAFSSFVQSPEIPRKRPDIVTFIFEPFQHFRDLLQLFCNVLKCTKSNSRPFLATKQIVSELQKTYWVIITSNGGFMEPLNDGKPLLNLQDLETRIVFTKCQPFVLNKSGRKWIFGSELSRIENNSLRNYWALLFNDIILFSKVSRDRVLFIIEEPLSISNITEVLFNLKKETEFRLVLNPYGLNDETASSFCGPYVRRSQKKYSSKSICVALRAKNVEIKSIWQNLLRAELYRISSSIKRTSSVMNSSSSEALDHDQRFQTNHGTLDKSARSTRQVRVKKFLKNVQGQTQGHLITTDIATESDTESSSSCSSLSEDLLFRKDEPIHEYDNFGFDDDPWDFKRFSFHFRDFNYYKQDCDSLNESCSITHSTSTL